MSGYRNDTFDRLADQSAKAMNLAERQRLVLEMQRILMEDVPYIPLYNPRIIEGVRRGKYKGWVSALEGIGNLWSFCLVGTQ
jgi:ABC-type transport system substrate-binding protein